MSDVRTRRVIEVQSDLYQKGGIEKAKRSAKQLSDKEFEKTMIEAKKAGKSIDEYLDEKIKPLTQYNDPTAHFRMVREEIATAAKDGKTKLQFPTGKTAMDIEGLSGDLIDEITQTNIAQVQDFVKENLIKTINA